MTVKTDRFWQLTGTLGGTRPSCEMPIGKGDQIRGYGMCGVKATDFAAGPRRNVLGAATIAMGTCYAPGARSRSAATALATIPQKR